MMERITIAQAKKIDLINYLKSIGYEPEKIRGDDFWYLSPLRNENTPSFKVNRKLNVWYDHGVGKGGTIIDFGINYFRCSVAEFLQLLDGNPVSPVIGLAKKDENRQTLGLNSAGEKKENPVSKTAIVDVRELENKTLLDYMKRRSIPPEIAKQLCREVDFSLNGLNYIAIGFQNNAGGYELRNENFKSSSSPKGITFIDTGAKSVTVFEGFFDYLSYKVMNPKADDPPSNFLILNSLAFFNRSRELMEKHDMVNLYLDRDTAGIKCTKEALESNPNKYTDKSFLYEYKKDLNDWLSQKNEVKRSQNFRRYI
ncbi:DNA primase [Flavobacterium zepuense]|uniref:DNA primase n=1 Tax=Flavobacterium zepuense TaxID=2593302 RepID=A0A552V6A2_9FLAO|nr:toprim domain-containing protein [Flavobacterium zepuense]TRW25968.1 DNA primase [Flavobacterium zepuense]